MQTKPTKLDSSQKHILKLIARDSKEDGWTSVSAQVYPVILQTMPTELCVLESTGSEGCGRVKLTDKGREILNSMAWLL